MTRFTIWPEEASTYAAGVDSLYIFLLVICTAMVVLIAAAVIAFAIKYRRRPGNELAVQIQGSIPLETFWTLTPMAIFMVMFFWGAGLYFERSSPPQNAAEIYVVGKQWMWKLQHPEGPREINELHVPAGQPVKLIMTSEDVIHSFYVPAFRIKQDVLPGRYTLQWFQATKRGRYHLFCAEYCGTNHARMIGWIDVMDPADYQRWLSGSGGGPSLVSSGEKLFQELGCAHCHSRDCPPLQGLYGHTVALDGGGTVVADDDYLRESILDPQAKIVAGYQPLMPTFKGQVSEQALIELIAYIRSLGDVPSGSTAGALRGLPTDRETQRR